MNEGDEITAAIEPPDSNIVEQIHDLVLDEDCPFRLAAAVLKADFAGRRRVVSGRGLSVEEARAACIAEGIERWSSIYSLDRALIWGSEAEIGGIGVTPDSLLLISDEQYAKRAEWNRVVNADHWLPARRNPDRRLAWMKAHSLTSSAGVLVPVAYCLLGYPSAAEDGFPIPDSSGLAAGHSVEWCVSRALLELVERDAVSIWWYGRVARPEAVLDRRKLPVLEQFEKWVERADRRLWLLDLMHDLGIPVVAAVTCDAAGRNLSFGFAASWTWEEAAYQALGELVQFEATKRMANSSVAANASGFMRRCSDASVDDWPFVRGSAGPKPVPVVDFPEQGTVSLSKRLQQRGLGSFVVDLTKPNSGLSVVRAIVPGLRHLWPRFAPGRLFDVPFELGWHSRRLREEELNPVRILY